MQTDFKCVVVSDTHGDNRAMLEVIEREKPFDTLIHCGDVEGDLESILGTQTFGYFSVAGNCDVFTDAPKEKDVKFGLWNVFVTHGHLYNVRFGRERLVRAGQSRKAHVILYGHTHMPIVYEDERTGILVVNPGSLSRPRQFPGKKTYAVLTISADRHPGAVVKYY